MNGPSSPGDGDPPHPIARIIGTGLFVGYIPWASGTFGTVVGCLVLLIPGVWQPAVLWPLAGLTFVAGVWSAASIARFEGNRLSATAARAKERFQPDSHAAPDPSIVVIDEIVGVWIAALHIPASVATLLIIFFAFRVFDILKPPPVAQLERIPNGWGIMLDDVVAGVYANVSTRLILFLAALIHLQ